MTWVFFFFLWGFSQLALKNAALFAALMSSPGLEGLTETEYLHGSEPPVSISEADNELLLISRPRDYLLQLSPARQNYSISTDRIERGRGAGGVNIHSSHVKYIFKQD